MEECTQVFPKIVSNFSLLCTLPTRINKLKVTLDKNQIYNIGGNVMQQLRILFGI